MGRKAKKYYLSREDYYRTDIEDKKLIKEPMIDYYRFFNDWREAEFSQSEEFPQYVRDIYNEFLTMPIKPKSVIDEQQVNPDIAVLYDTEMRKSMYSDCVTLLDTEKRSLELEEKWHQHLNAELAEEWCWGKQEELYNMFKADTNNYTRFGSPVRIPTWFFGASNMIEDDFYLTDVEKIALTHVIHFGKTPNGYYKECAGHVERWCRCSTEVAHKAFISLYVKRLIDLVPLRYDFVFGLNRNMAWKPNMIYLECVARRYGRRFDA